MMIEGYGVCLLAHPKNDWKTLMQIFAQRFAMIRMMNSRTCHTFEASDMTKAKLMTIAKLELLRSHALWTLPFVLPSHHKDPLTYYITSSFRKPIPEKNKKEHLCHGEVRHHFFSSSV
jgi:hypothetical protein